MFWRALIYCVNLFKSTLRSARSSVISMKMCTMSSLIRLNVFASSSRSIFAFLRRKSFASTFRIESRWKSHSTRILLRQRRKTWKEKKNMTKKIAKKKENKKNEKNENDEINDDDEKNDDVDVRIVQIVVNKQFKV
jgi:hypothetical protein